MSSLFSVETRNHRPFCSFSKSSLLCSSQSQAPPGKLAWTDTTFHITSVSGSPKLELSQLGKDGGAVLTLPTP